MAIHHNNRIITDNLTLLYDQGNIKCADNSENLLPNSDTWFPEFANQNNTNNFAATSIPPPISNTTVFIYDGFPEAGVYQFPHVYDQINESRLGHYTFSIYWKDIDVTANGFALRVTAQAGNTVQCDARQNFSIPNMLAGTFPNTAIGSGSDGFFDVTVRTESAGNDWYRSSMTFLANSEFTQIRAEIRYNAYATITGSIGKFYVANPQFEYNQGTTKFKKTSGTAAPRTNFYNDLVDQTIFQGHTGDSGEGLPSLIESNNMIHYHGDYYIDTGKTNQDINVYNNSYTVNSWVFFDEPRSDTDNNDCCIIGNIGGGGSDGGDVWHLTNRAGGWRFGHWAEDTQTGVCEGNTWLNVCFTFNAETGTQSVYVNGTANGTPGTGKANLDISDRVVTIGSWYGNSSFFVNQRGMKGFIDYVAVYGGKELTSDEVMFNYKAMKSRYT